MQCRQCRPCCPFGQRHTAVVNGGYVIGPHAIHLKDLGLIVGHRDRCIEHIANGIRLGQAFQVTRQAFNTRRTGVGAQVQRALQGHVRFLAPVADTHPHRVEAKLRLLHGADQHLFGIGVGVVFAFHQQEAGRTAVKAVVDQPVQRARVVHQLKHAAADLHRARCGALGKGIAPQVQEFAHHRRVVSRRSGADVFLARGVSQHSGGAQTVRPDSQFNKQNM